MYCLNLPYLRCTDGGIHVHAVHIFSSSSRRQQQERQGQPGVFLLWLHCLLCGPGNDRSGDAHFQGCSTCPSVFGACLSRNTNHVGFDQRRNLRVVQVSFPLLSLLVPNFKMENTGIQFVHTCVQSFTVTV